MMTGTPPLEECCRLGLAFLESQFGNSFFSSDDYVIVTSEGQDNLPLCHCFNCGNALRDGESQSSERCSRKRHCTPLRYFSEGFPEVVQFKAPDTFWIGGRGFLSYCPFCGEHILFSAQDFILSRGYQDAKAALDSFITDGVTIDSVIEHFGAPDVDVTAQQTDLGEMKGQAVVRYISYLNLFPKVLVSVYELKDGNLVKSIASAPRT